MVGGEKAPEEAKPAGCHLVILIGARGSGKTTVARLLAEALGWGWVDADAFLEEHFGQTIRDIFAAEGEAGFRDKESEVLRALCARKQHVIATGGGVVLRAANRALLRTAGRVVWLTADVDTLWQRVQSDRTTLQRRPALTADGGRGEIEEVLRQREPLYGECAHRIVPTAGRAPAEVVAEVLAWTSVAASGQ
jgi:shikimate kinase